MAVGAHSQAGSGIAYFLTCPHFICFLVGILIHKSTFASGTEHQHRRSLAIEVSRVQRLQSNLVQFKQLHVKLVRVRLHTSKHWNDKIHIVWFSLCMRFNARKIDANERQLFAISDQ